MSDLVARLRHLVSLNERKNGGPYQGAAAEACVKAMGEAADLIESQAAKIAELERENGELVAKLMHSEARTVLAGRSLKQGEEG